MTRTGVDPAARVCKSSRTHNRDSHLQCKNGILGEMNGANMAEIQPLVAGNWKMNGLKPALGELKKLTNALGGASGANTDVMICPPFTLISSAAHQCNGSSVQIGAQDCHANESGAHTGDIAPEMLSDAGASAVIVGHSERRADHGETNDMVNAKAQAVWRAGLTAIICVGETDTQRKAGETLEVIANQLTGSIPDAATAANVVLAYEPVWAIGTGLTPTTDDVAEVHAAIRTQLEAMLPAGEGRKVRILYGGSVKPSNASELMAVPNVNGALVGGASLKADDFLGIIAAYT